MNTRACRILIFVLLFCLGATQGATWTMAQRANPTEPLMGSEASPAVAPVAAKPISDFGGDDGIYRILVVGDALAGGLGAGMTRMAQEDPRIEVLNRFNESSGLARIEVYDWPNAIAKIVSNKPVDAIVVLVGVNDRQDIRSGNVRYAFKSPGWVTGYSANIDRLLAAAQDAKAKTFWISVPPMADQSFDADMHYVSDLHRQRVAAKAGQFIDVRPFFLAPDGSYVDKGPDETGVERKLRSRDGVTFFKQGNNRFGQLVLGAIKALEANTAPPAVVPAPTAPIAVAPVAVAPIASAPLPKQVAIAPPSFGQDGLDGEQITFQADAVKSPAAVPVPAIASSTAEAIVPKQAAKAGSQAQRLLVQGLVAAAPAGRFDDFTVPAVAQ
jgi:uncharacterized protein